MFLSDLLEKRDEIKKIVEKNKGSNVRVFGSTANGDATETSDLDLLVQFKDNASLFDLIETKLELQELLHIKVDVVSENGLKDNEIGINIKRSAISLWIEIKHI